MVAAWRVHRCAFIDRQFTLTFVADGHRLCGRRRVPWDYFVWQYRDHGPTPEKVEYSHGNTKLEVIWTVLTAVLFVGLNLMGSNVWARSASRRPRPNAVPVEVTGMQFAWYFRYPGADGKFGATSPKLMDPSAGNEAAIGLDTN